MVNEDTEKTNSRSEKSFLELVTEWEGVWLQNKSNNNKFIVVSKKTRMLQIGWVNITICIEAWV